MADDSLWGDLSTIERPRTPKSILRQQAELLNAATGGVILAEVVDSSTSYQLESTLVIVAPALNDYRYTLVSVRHKIDLYPCEVRIPDPYQLIECEDEARFVAALKSVLGAPRTRQIISALLAQSEAS
ncbi:MAG: hypothetical protein HYR72_07020 [Deltaproteobacteria bacterium]|nr:hypothetical protein [Deltaproteobacteria bacterium]MBI3387213.1 hypothetical protein [Deltaproteobacteria bacterium]